MARDIILGIDCQVLYMPDGKRTTAKPYNEFDHTSHSYAAGDWVEIEPVREVTLNLSAGTADVTTRASNGWRQTVPTLKEGSVDFSIRWTPDNDAGTPGVIFRELLEAFDNQCPAAFMFLDGNIDPDDFTSVVGRCGEFGDITGLMADFAITKFTRNEGLEDGVFADVTVEPTVGTIYPEWVTLGFTAVGSAS